jgi:hypothetical protein
VVLSTWDGTSSSCRRAPSATGLAITAVVIGITMMLASLIPEMSLRWALAGAVTAAPGALYLLGIAGLSLRTRSVRLREWGTWSGGRIPGRLGASWWWRDVREDAMDGRLAATSRVVAACAVLALVWVVATHGAPRLVWEASPADVMRSAMGDRDAVRFASAAPLAPVPLRLGPGWLPAGLYESARYAYVTRDSQRVERTWVPDRFLGPVVDARGATVVPHLTVSVEHQSPDLVQLDDALADVVGVRGGFQTFTTGVSGFSWTATPGLDVRVTQSGELGLDRATLLRIARSMHPVAGSFTFPLRARSMPAGLSADSPGMSIAAAVHPDRSGGWAGWVNWSLTVQVAVGDRPSAEVPRDGSRLLVGGRDAWYAVQPALGVGGGEAGTGGGGSRVFVVLEQRPGTVVTVSTWQHDARPADLDALGRIATSVERAPMSWHP